MYEVTDDAGLTCRRCGISRPTLRLWTRRYRELGEVGLVGLSRRPKRSPAREIFDADRELILSLRCEPNLGARRIQAELRLAYGIELSITSITKVLDTAAVPPLRPPRRRKRPTRYARPVPGDRVQLDTMKVAPGVYQYTAVDDCSRFRVLAVYPRRTAAFCLTFLARVVEEMPFPIQRVQTDRGGEFMAEKVQRWLKSHAIKYRPIPPRSPHLNGKVERSQATDLQEFWTRHDPKDSEIARRIEEWQFDYNWRRPHGSLGGKTPIDRVCELGQAIPLLEEVAAAYDGSEERIRQRNYTIDQALSAIWAARKQDQKAAGASRRTLHGQ